jgi:tRNA(Ile)-lysidine synthase
VEVRALLGQVSACLRSLGEVPGLVAAVSGGPDSVALVRALVAARASPLVLAHLNHQLRGADSDADERFVADLHAALRAAGAELHLVSARLDVAEQARSAGANLEAHARQVRYRWLAEVARAHGLRWVATGHTASDQAETVLHHLLRGTGLAGLRGIASRRLLAPGVEVVRPLLGVTRAEVLAYLGELGQSYREDASNADLQRTRNRIRHELLPHLAERYNPRVAEVLGRLARQADEVCRAEEAEAEALLRAAELPRAGARVVLDAARLAAAPRRLVRAALRSVWAREGWPLGGMSYEVWERLADLAGAGQGASDLPGGVHARRRGRVLQLGRSERRGLSSLSGGAPGPPG